MEQIKPTSIMKRIMFKDRYGFTQAVLDGKKTMTRRSVKWDILCGGREDTICVIAVKDLPGGRRVFTAYNTAGNPVGQVVSAYHIGEEVAVAQKYKDVRDIIGDVHDGKSIKFTGGWANKMFVRADLMPYRIRITNIKVERLQDISEEDCLREGIVKTDCVAPYGFPVGNGKWKNYRTPQDAFASLIDKVSGRGTWERNPWVFAYEFELVK